MGKRCLAMVVYDSAAAAQQRDAKRPTAGDAGSVVPYGAAKPAGVEPIDAVPLKAIAPRRRLQRPLPAPVNREDPPCLRAHILPALGLRADVEVRFIHEKRVTSTDLDPHQNRFRIPTDGALRRLSPLLTVEELDAANLLYDPATVAAQQQQQLELEPEPESETEAEQGKKRRKKQGMVHGGLPVRLVDLAAGASGELLLSRWTSSHGTIVKGSGYMDYIRRCSFKENDAVEIWAFKQREFRLLGKTIFHGSPLHVLLVKRDAKQHGCRHCH
ncbi:hypothetical protein GQ55_3G285800 [Panicum hallii var. hallii]|uniref:Uncharacterized protein n=1 Tax=Panicum hallii var. hallii TaxID=1504633 RepID=A0A2T7EEC6_9POAL|nr:hypothetical protein GQ55_3G285800 [Panicum hallii var. hallii]